MRSAPGAARSPRRKRFGQHFLEPVWVQKVVAAIAPHPEDRFLEIGPGRGQLTAALAPDCQSLVAVEIDRDLAAELMGRALPGVRVVVGDFLETPVDAWRDPAATYRVAGNLPYNVGTPILFRLLALARDRVLQDAVLMLQREVAERLTARPDQRTWGPLGILTQLQADVDRVLDLPPGAFRPPPRVHSTVIRLRFRPEAVPVDDYARFERLVRGLFTHRRKTLANALKTGTGLMFGLGRRGAPPIAGDRTGAPSRFSPERALAEAGLDGRRRPETLQLAELARLSRTIR